MKSMKYLMLCALAAGLAACGARQGNKVVTKNAMHSLAYQATTSIAMMNDLQNAPMANALGMKYMGGNQSISEEAKTQIESLLPTVDLLMKNSNSFNSEVYTSDRPEYETKQVVSFADISGEKVSYTLYYSLGNESTDIDEDDDDDEIEIVTTYTGIAVVEDEEYTFKARSTEEIEDDETEKEFVMKIYKGERDYIKVVHETETEEDEFEEKYRYTIVQDQKVVRSFMFEQEKEHDDELESKIKLSINNERFSFKFFEVNGVEYIRVKYNDKAEEQGKLIYKKVVTILEDDTEQITFEEVASIS